MKTRRGKVTSKNSVTSKVNKKKYGHNPKKSWRLRSDVTIEKLDKLNEVIRETKCQRAEGHGKSWKLIPKDSCEVYKARRKRKMENRKRTAIEENTSEDESNTRRTGSRVVKFRQSNRRCRRKNTRPYTRRSNRRREQPSDSSITSADCDCKCTCESPSSTASSARSSATRCSVTRSNVTRSSVTRSSVTRSSVTRSSVTRSSVTRSSATMSDMEYD